MHKIPLIASRPARYAGKALRAGVEFMAPKADAKVLVAAGLATYATRTVTPAPKARAPEPAGEDLAALRAAYETLARKKAHPFWRAARLKAEIEALRSADGGTTFA